MKKQPEVSRVGVWMDHTTAILLSPDEDGLIEKVNSPFQGKKRIFGEVPDGTRLGNHRSSNDEYTKHNTEIAKNHAFFKALADKIKSYDEIFLFGPGTAYKEFANYVHEEKIPVGKIAGHAPADYVTDNQKRQIVRSFFGVDAIDWKRPQPPKEKLVRY